MDELKVFEEAQRELELWRLRQIRNPPERPERGSDLDEDDKAFAHHLISESVRICLISAGEHLRLVWDGLQQKNLYSSAQHTAVRGALVGAAQAVWILAPADSTTRRQRGHSVIGESYKWLRKYHEKKLDLVPQLGYSEAGKQQIAAQIEWIESRQRALEAVQPALMGLNLDQHVSGRRTGSLS